MTYYRARSVHRLLLAAAALLTLATPAQALAARAEVVDGELRFTAASGEPNGAGIQVTESGELSFYDNRVEPTAGAGCRVRSQDPGTDDVVCSAQGVTRVTVALGDRNDSFSIEARTPALSYSGGAGADGLDYVGAPELGPATVSLDGMANDGREGRDNIASDVESVGGTFVGDRLIGGESSVMLNGRDGDDELTGGAGDDEIAAAYVSESGLDLGELYPEGRDTIGCGGGNDQVFADRGDVIASDCEVIGLPPRSGSRYTYTGSPGADRITVRQFVYAVVRARGGNDVVRLPGEGNGTLFGQGGNDNLRGDTGADRFSGGAGRDTINARDRSRDKVSCGSGRDRVVADRVDAVTRNCERVSRR